MLKESHKVLKHLMRQEQLLKDELAQTRRAAKLSETLNVEYLKNIVVSFLVKVYGDADDDEHVKLARVLQTVLQFTPAESARVDEKIDAYLSSWVAPHRRLAEARPRGDELVGRLVWGRRRGGHRT